MIRRVPRLSELRAAWWADRALRAGRRQLAAGEFRRVQLSTPPRLPASARRGVEALLRRRDHTCLEGAIIRQRWLASQGVMRDVVIGVTAPKDFEAHAWLEPRVGSGVPASMFEITRLAP